MITMLAGGALLVPFRAEAGKIIGDGKTTVLPGEKDYPAWLEAYRKQPQRR